MEKSDSLEQIITDTLKTIMALTEIVEKQEKRIHNLEKVVLDHQDAIKNLHWQNQNIG